MLLRAVIFTLVLVAANLALPGSNPAQQKSEPPSSGFTADYPSDEAGVLIQNGDWLALSQESPTKSRVKHGAAASLTYGAFPATFLSEYAGIHSKPEVHLAKPVICICHFAVLPGNPVLVRLHSDPKHGIRVLDGGRMPVIGAKVIEAKDSDLFPADLLRPEKSVWLLRPTQELPDGEYALMFGAQNLAIFTFSVAKPRGIQAPSPK
jgi:hypothetical protein